jgi:DNA-binding LacI/PurR family transcriptional regulator
MPAFKMGQLACQMMLALLSGGEPEARQILLPTELVRRESMGKIGG